MKKLERIIVTTPPVSFLIRKSKQIILPGFQGLPLYDVARFFLQQMQQIGLNERAGAISFDFLMAIPPLSIFIFTLLSHLPGSKKLYTEALILVKEIAPDASTYNMIKGVMDDFFSTSTSLLSFGLILAIYFSSNAMLTIMRTFNKSMLHIETEKRNFLELRWAAIKLTVYIVILILATIFILFSQSALLNLITGWLDIKTHVYNWVVEVLRLLITFLLVFISIALIYRYAPSVEKKWKFFSPGATLATILIIAFTILFSYWVNNFASYNKVYGSLGSIMILMLLIFVNSLVLLIGFELNVSINSLKSIAEKRQQSEGQLISD
jgi:membrane protein